MNLKQLGNSDLKITPVGLGTWAIGGEGAFAWGPQDDAESIAAIRRGIELGINWIDTAAIYGFGHSEEVVASALKDIGSSERPYVFTKCSFVWDDEGNFNHNLSPDSLRMEVEGSLRRLQVDVLDLYQIHAPAWPFGAPATEIEDAWTTLLQLKDEGKMRAIGISNFNVDEIKRIQNIAPVTSLQPPYSMLMRQIEDEILPYCLEQNIGTIVYSPMHNGLLSGKMTRERIAALPDSDWRKHASPAFKEPHLTHNLKLVDLLSNIGERHNQSAAGVSIAWTLRHPAVTGAIVGVRRSEQVDGIIGAQEFRLNEDEIAEIDGMLPDSLPMFEVA